MLEVGNYVDYWCTEAKCWKSGVVTCISYEGTVTVNESKTSKNI